MNPLLIFFREEHIEFWSIDQNGRLIEINCGKSNSVPLYFLVSKDEITMDQFAKEQFLLNTEGTYGDYWLNLLNTKTYYKRYNIDYPFSDLLFYSLKEKIIPDILRINYGSVSLDSYLKSNNLIVIFDSFIDEEHRNAVLKGLIEVVGFDVSSILSFEYWELLRGFYENNGGLSPNETFVEINSAFTDLFIYLISKNPPFILNKKVLKGRGNDPQLDTILEYVTEQIKRRGSLLSDQELKRELKNDAIAILGKLEDGLVKHKIKNINLGVNSFMLSFHKDAIINRLNNKASLHFIQNEFDLFRISNQANGTKIFLNGSILNQESFIVFFKSTYSNVMVEPSNFDHDFKLFILNFCLKKLKQSETKSIFNEARSLGTDEELLTTVDNIINPNEKKKPPLPSFSKLKKPSLPPLPPSLPPLPPSLPLTPIQPKPPKPPLPPKKKLNSELTLN